MTLEGYDYVIIGAGSAGCVLASKLGADTSNSVLILEAGPMDHDLMIHIPAGVYKAWRDPKINWNYQSEAEPALNNRSVFTPRGKVVGGSSSINSMVYMRGHPLDYDSWAKDFGLDDWSYAHCLPYFKAEETSDRGGDEWRGDQGPLGVTKVGLGNPLYDAFLEAGAQSGQGRSEDLNGFQPEGVARFDATRRNGKRCSAAVAYLKPALKRGNVTLLTKAVVKKVIIQGGRANAVQFDYKGQEHNVEANKEVILSGGAINSPQLLMLSGVGPADHLRSVGIDPLVNLPGVGRNLQDHASAIVQYASKKSFPIHKVDKAWRKAVVGLQWMLTGKGLAISNIWEAGGLIRSNDHVSYPNIQYHFSPVGFEYEGHTIKLRQAFAIHVDLLRPRSHGSIKLKSGDPYDKPAIGFSYLAEPGDLEELAQGIEKIRQLIAQRAFDEFRGQEMVPGPCVKSAGQIANWLRLSTETDFHPCGTCAMGEGDMAVVDNKLRVKGVENLRVVDASVMPRVLSANLNAPTQMIAAKISDDILGQPSRVPHFAKFSFQL